MRDMNARMIHAEDDEEEQVFENATVKGRNALTTNTAASRNMLIRFCLKNGFQLANAFFEKSPDKLITYRPKEVKEREPIAPGTHEQIDYLITKKGCIRILNCESDTTSLLNSDHFPVIASDRTKFKAIHKTQQTNQRYSNNTLWKDKAKLNADGTHWITKTMENTG
jgi:hypothetical protein